MVTTDRSAAPTGVWQRPRYFDRQELSAADLNAGVDYARQRLRWHNRFLHGWGVVAGARVQRVSAEDLWHVNVGEGYAVTPLGDEVYIAGQVFDIRPGIERCLGTQDECPDLDTDPTATSVRILRANINPPGRDSRTDYNVEWVDLCLLREVNLNGFVLQHTLNPNTPQAALFTYHRFSGEAGVLPRGSIVRVHSGSRLADTDQEPNLIHRYVAGNSEVGNWRLNNSGDTLRILNATGVVQDTRSFLPGSLTPVDAGAVYLVACPLDTPECPKPGVPADCLPPGSNYQFSRTREGYNFEIICELPPSHRAPAFTCEVLEGIVCEGDPAPMPPDVAADDNCVVLATIQVLENQVLVVDDLTDRHQLLSQAVLQERERCVCQHEPAPPPPPPTPPPTSPTTPPTTPPTRPTVFTLFTRFTRFTDLTLFTDFIPTGPPIFTGRPDLGGGLPIFTGVGPDFGFDRNEFDLDRGRVEPPTAIEGIGAARAERLGALGVTNIVSFAAMASEVAAEVLGVSEVRVAEMQDRARGIMRR